MTTDRETLRASLSSVDFPISKEGLVDHAENNGFDTETVRALRALPTADYDNVTEVMRSVLLDKADEEGQSSSDKAHQAGRSGHEGLAEHQTSVPANPIAEEIGENRKPEK